MKRSMLLVLAGFGLASMLFALVAFVGVDNNKGLICVRVAESYNAIGYILIAYPSGETEKIDLEMSDFQMNTKKLSIENVKKVSATINKLESNGYSLYSHSSSGSGGSIIDTYIFK